RARYLAPLHPPDLLCQTSREVVAAIGDAHEDDVGDALVALEHLVRDPRERATDVVGLHDLAAHRRELIRERLPASAGRRTGYDASQLPSRPRRTGLKGTMFVASIRPGDRTRKRAGSCPSPPAGLSWGERSESQTRDQIREARSRGRFTAMEWGVRS